MASSYTEQIEALKRFRPDKSVLRQVIVHLGSAVELLELLDDKLPPEEQNGPIADFLHGLVLDIDWYLGLLAEVEGN